MGVLHGPGLDAEQLSRMAMVVSPALASSEPMNSVSSLSTPIGVITAAVPQAKTSVISPDARRRAIRPG